MTIFVMRHAHAVPEGADRPDALRHLSDAGRSAARASAAWLCEQPSPPTLIASSPIPRAVQTAEIVAAALGVDRLVVLAALTTPDGSARHVADWLAQQAEHVLAVGHEPNVSGAVAYLIGATDYPTLAPAQIAVIEGGAVVAASPVTNPAIAPPSIPGLRSRG